MPFYGQVVVFIYLSVKPCLFTDKCIFDVLVRETPPFYGQTVDSGVTDITNKALVHETWKTKKRMSSVVRLQDILSFSYWVRESNPYCKIENLEY